MGQEYSRTQRVGDFLQRELAILVRNLCDPRLGIVSITAVDVSRDLSHAKVYFTMLDCESDIDKERVTSILNRASGFLRRSLSRTSGLRIVPKIKFYFDSSISRARDLNALIYQANQSKIKNNGTNSS